jgi:2,5-diamino-6-(ribosylamino)-4(3H)-pyrimidinone 5'-phosphate reductase
MVGVGTVLADDPSLTLDDAGRRGAREDRGESPDPARVVADSRLRTPDDARFLDGTTDTYVLASEDAPTERRRELAERDGVSVITAGEDRVDLAAALGSLEAAGIDRLMVEGGGELVFSLLHEGLVDDLSVFVAPAVIGGREAPTLADGEGFADPADFATLELHSVERMDGGVLLRWSVE